MGREKLFSAPGSILIKTTLMESEAKASVVYQAAFLSRAKSGRRLSKFPAFYTWKAPWYCTTTNSGVRGLRM